MTLCIAALCRDQIKDKRTECAVISSDQRTETLTAAGETATKYQRVGAGWVALFAGDLNVARELMVSYSRFLHENEASLRAHDVVERLYQPLDEMREKLRDRLVQREHSCSLADFRANPDWFTAETRRQTEYDLLQLDFDAQLLLVGIVSGNTRLFRVHAQHHIIQSCDAFGAIGTGAEVAEMMLYLRQYSQWWALPRAVYGVFEAQLIGGLVAPRVGRKHEYFVLKRGQENPGDWYPFAVHDFSEKALEKTYKKIGPKAIPLSFSLPEDALYDILGYDQPEEPQLPLQPPLEEENDGA